MKTKLILIAFGIQFALQGFAQDREVAEKKTSKAEIIRQSATACGEREMDLFERVKNRLPTNEEMDMILDACVNQNFDRQ